MSKKVKYESDNEHWLRDVIIAIIIILVFGYIASGPHTR